MTMTMTMTLIAGCANINAPADECGWVKPISVAEADRLTTAIKQGAAGRQRSEGRGRWLANFPLERTYTGR